MPMQIVPDAHGVAVLLLIAVALFLFTRDRLPLETSSLAILVILVAGFQTPFGYQTNLLILSAGGYKFSDFLRVGVPLAIIMWIGFSIVLPLLYDI